MVYIDADKLDQTILNQKIRLQQGDMCLERCLGQRFIAAGRSEGRVEIHGVPGNALGAYLNGAEIEVMGNAQDAVGDTMNAGRIVIHGCIGDTAGYAMRGGEIYVEGNAGYRAGIHMKAYQDKLPAIVIGGRAGSFLGEYQAGGMIVVLGLHLDGASIVSNYPCTGMHGGKLFLRSDCKGILFPKQVSARPATQEDMEEVTPYLKQYADLFGCDYDYIRNSPFTVVVPDSRNPYRQMYVAN
ncbi:MAG: glutamate synthase [Candidatus Heteroscillospira sp.]|jgi:glutamate synthase domain-containing protein 3